MLQILFVVPGLGLRVHSFSLMLLLACVGALHLAAWRARRERIDPDAVHGMALWLFVGGMIGARVLYLVQNPEQFHEAADLVRIWRGGIVFYGCILGGLVGSLLYWARRPFPFWAMADAVAPALALGIAVGRLGCFLNGCCYGALCERPWAVRFPAETPPWVRHVEAGLIPLWAPRSLAVHPKQLYAALAGLALLGLLSAYYPRRRRDGEVMALLMIGYPATRFLVEFYRGDRGGLFGGLTISQYISLALLACGLVTWRLLSRLPATRLADMPIT
jgi:phosphatidylglycerol---prolipoprotein diacylglyceryl transferase